MWFPYQIRHDPYHYIHVASMWYHVKTQGPGNGRLRAGVPHLMCGITYLMIYLARSNYDTRLVWAWTVVMILTIPHPCVVLIKVSQTAHPVFKTL